MTHKTIFFIFALIFLLVDPVLADEAKEEQRLIRQYTMALETGNRPDIYRAWKALDQNPQAVTYLEEHFPRQFQSYRLLEIAVRLRKIKRDFENRPTPVATLEEPTATKRREALTNQEVVALFPNNKRTDNRTLALKFPLSTRLENRAYIASRREMLFR